jgi:hypothetical protein
LTTLWNIKAEAYTEDLKTGLHNPTIVSVLVIFGCTAGSLLTACGLVVDIAIVSAQKYRTQRVSQPCNLQDGEGIAASNKL